MTVDVAVAIEVLGYSERWRASALVPEEFFVKQLSAFHDSDGTGPEHYRYAAFQHALDSRQGLTDEEFATFVALAELELTTVLYASPLIELARWPHLTRPQLDELERRTAAWPAAVSRALKKRPR